MMCVIVNMCDIYARDNYVGLKYVGGVSFFLSVSSFLRLIMLYTTVESPKRGHFGNSTVVLSSEVVLFSEVV